MSKEQGQSDAIRRAKELLGSVDMSLRFAAAGFERPKNGNVQFRAFGMDVTLDEKFDCFDACGKMIKPGDHILILHYLLCDKPIEPTGEFITFRDMPGGQFYWQPFLSRSINPLLARTGNDLDALRVKLARFDHTFADAGDLSAVIHCIGKLELMLVYHRGDEEFGPAAEVLFDSCIKRVYCSEDAAFLASRICLGLL